MDSCQFNNIVLEHRNSMLVIGCVILVVGIVAVLVVELYVRGVLECKYLQFQRYKVSPTLLMLIPIAAVLIYFSIVVINCNADIANNSYVTYIGVCEYESESVELVGEKVTIYVGKGHEIVPRGTNYGKCIYSKHSKVIVYWEPLLSNTCPVMEAH